MNTQNFHSSFFSSVNPNSLVRKPRPGKTIPSNGLRTFFSSTLLLARGSQGREPHANKRTQREQDAKSRHQRHSKPSRDEQKDAQNDQQYIPHAPRPRYHRPRSSYPLAVLIAMGCTYITLSYNQSPFVQFPLPDVLKFTPSYLEKHFVLSQQNVDEGRIHTLITSSFMHATYPHLFLNMVGCLSIASMVNPLAFVTIWIGSSLTCSLASLYVWKHGLPFNHTNSSLNPANKACGASGSLCGLFGMIAVRYPQIPFQIAFIPIGIPAWLLIGGETVYSVLALKNGWQPSLGHAGHLGGTAFGLLAGLVSIRFGMRRF